MGRKLVSFQRDWDESKGGSFWTFVDGRKEDMSSNENWLDEENNTCLILDNISQWKDYRTKEEIDVEFDTTINNLTMGVSQYAVLLLKGTKKTTINKIEKEFEKQYQETLDSYKEYYPAACTSRGR